MTELMKQRLSNMASPSTMGRLLTGTRLIVLLGLIAALVTTAVVIGLWQGNSQYRPLYGEQEKFDRSQVISVLEQQGMDYYIEPQQGNVMVDRDSLGKARLALAAAGIEAQLPAGLEILSQDSSLGTSQFIESARYRHGLEGELALSIMELDAITNVRVHLAIPKQTLFVRREKEQPSASVVLSLASGRELTTEQVTAIVNLVAGSVPDLNADRVNVIDQQGRLLSSVINSDGKHSRNSSSYLEYVQNLERSYINRAARMLRPMVGIDNFQVEVAADINYDRTEATEESYAPEGSVRNEFNTMDRRVGKAAQGVPGALSNRPPEEDEEGDPNAGNERSESSRDYALDRVLKHTLYQQGQLKSLSVSILLNGQPETFTPEQLTNIKQMLADAMGINEARGDQFSVLVYPFTKAEANLLAEEPVWWMQLIWLDYLRYILSAIVALVILLVVVRPAVRQLSGASKSTALAVVNDEQEAVTDKSANKKAALSNDTSPEIEVTPVAATAEGASLSSVVASEDYPELPSPETGLEVQSSYLQMLSEKEPERVAHVVKQWITPKDDDN
ncbi:flagellar basal-body MS-ring/collar protein FliF [Photobacterium lipolyticum]|uniref:Flagellar M-ring protein n=1 Tax=Photobacterium lipolyticum TaxID=266810 RepID=A0A2T3MU82_9GAMM|nr:flagellar basal-body MS-ring/collar protein FliF [Photobacterium lipolyticum]PSW03521.1 flagellar M-ring protein FliF [Photobacterium lipolyticum]